MSNPIDPDHYKQGDAETWDVIQALGLGYLDGNAVKYISRWRYKGGVEDLRKAIAYLEKMIEIIEQQPEQSECLNDSQLWGDEQQTT